MILDHYLAATAHTDQPAVRQAMAVALALEPSHDSASYERFYRRVLDELERTARTVSTAHTTGPIGHDRCTRPAGDVRVRLAFSH